MATVTTLLAGSVLFLISHLGGQIVGSILSFFGVAGFGGRAVGILKIGRALVKVVKATKGTDRHEAARNDLRAFLDAHPEAAGRGLDKALADPPAEAPDAPPASPAATPGPPTRKRKTATT